MNEILLETKNLRKTFSLNAGFFAKKDKNVYAVNNVNICIEKGKTYGLVGESGCGKTTVARLIVGMYKPTDGSILHANEDGDWTDITELSRHELKKYREKVKYVFQDPSKSLNPRMSILGILTSGLKHSAKYAGKKDALEKAKKIMTEIGLSEEDLYKHPHEFSGGQRQRISIARALIMEPEILICDEVVSALDVSVQAQILNLLQDLREKKGLSFIFIAHDLKVSCWFCDRIGVMYRGMLVEESDAQNLYKEALHPYTKVLFAGAESNFQSSSTGEMKTLLESPSGCPFAYRCPKAKNKCHDMLPEWTEVSDGHKVRCWEI